MDPKISGGLAGIAVVALAYCFSKVRQAVTAFVPAAALATAGRGAQSIAIGAKRVLTKFGENLILRTGMVAALVFTAQMFNFPINEGTSGHFLGGVFAAVILGPFAGSLAIAAVVIIQALFYADGGVIALGGNLVNMVVIGTFISYYLYAFLKAKLDKALSVGIAAWFSVVLAASACAVEIGLSGTYPLLTTWQAMLKPHVLIGLAEALITVVLLKIFNQLAAEEQ